MRLEVQGLGYAYDGGEPALVDVNFAAARGEILVLLGPNGSGKSTLLKCLASIFEPRTGSIEIEGVDVRNMGVMERARKTGYVPQMEGRGFPSTVLDTVLMGRRPHISWKPSRHDLSVASSVIESLDLAEFALRDVNQLSGGEKQKVLIARALANEPKILLLDEPTANLDLNHQLEVMERIEEQARKGITAIMAVHDLNLALRYAHRILLLNEGKVWASGGLETVTEENIAAVYGVEVVIERHLGHMMVTPTKRCNLEKL